MVRGTRANVLTHAEPLAIPFNFLLKMLQKSGFVTRVHYVLFTNMGAKHISRFEKLGTETKNRKSDVKPNPV